MRKVLAASVGDLEDPTEKGQKIILYRRVILISVSVIFLSGIGLLGYFIGRGSPPDDKETSMSPVTTGIFEILHEQENRCAAVEQINLQKELDDAQKEADQLAESLKNQQEALRQQEEAFQQQQEEIENLEETILNALMANLSEKTISRSSPTVNGYAKKAKELLSLQRKVRAFENTPEAEEIDLTEYKAAIKKQLANIPTLKPIPGSLGGYGYRIHPIFGYRQFHPAVDMGAAVGTPIKAAAAGRVSDTGYNRSAGKFVKINHGNGFETLYYHCSKLYVSGGDRVNKGDVIAAVGNTGTSTAPHLHFGITFYGSPVNPNAIIME